MKISNKTQICHILQFNVKVATSPVAFISFPPDSSLMLLMTKHFICKKSWGFIRTYVTCISNSTYIKNTQTIQYKKQPCNVSLLYTPIHVPGVHRCQKYASASQHASACKSEKHTYIIIALKIYTLLPTQ